MENNEIMVTEETKNAVEEVVKTNSHKGLWIAGGVAVAGGLAFLITKAIKRRKAKKAEQEKANDEDWAKNLETTVKEIKDEDID